MNKLRLLFGMPFAILGGAAYFVFASVRVGWRSARNALGF